VIIALIFSNNTKSNKFLLNLKIFLWGYSYMLKGVNKLIVDVANPNSEFFERAIFFVKPQMKDIPSKELNKSADAFISEQGNSAIGKAKNQLNQFKHGKNLPFSVLAIACAAGLGAAIAAVVLHFL